MFNIYFTLILSLFDILMRININIQKIYIEEFKIFNTNMLKFTIGPNQFSPINIGIKVTKPVKNNVFKMINFVTCTRSKILFLNDIFRGIYRKHEVQIKGITI